MSWPWRAYKWGVWRGSGRGHFLTSIQTWEWSRSKSHYEQQCFSSYQVIAFFRLSTRHVRFPANLAVIAWENSGHLATLRLVSLRNDVWGIDVEIPYWWRVTTEIWGRFWLVEANFSRGRTNQKHYADLGRHTSSVWNFSVRSADVTSRGNILGNYE